MPVIIAMGTTVLFWGIMFTACHGWGSLLFKIVGSGRTSEVRSSTTFFWCGFIVILALLQVWHLFLPVDWLATIILLGSGLTVWVFENSRWRISSISIRPGYAVILTIIGLWLANRGLDFVNNYDSGLYHFSMIRWLNEYPVIPGLANLHARLGFNQSYFLFVALLNVYPVFNQGYHVTNSFLVFVLSAQLLDVTWRTVKDSSAADIVVFLQCLLLPVAVGQGLTGNISSPSPDLAVFVCSIVTFIGFAQITTGSSENNPNEDLWLVLTGLCFVNCTLKLSVTVYSCTILCLMVAFFQKWNFRTFLILVGAVVLIAIPYGIRGFILSGYPAFPATFSFGLADWRLPIKETQETANWIYSWARMPGVPWQQVLASWSWIPSWCNRMLSVSEVVLPVAVAGGSAMWLLLSVTVSPTKRIMLRGGWWPVAPVIVGLVWWFLTAPDPRFATWLFWLAAAWPLAAVLLVNCHRGNVPITRYFAFSALIVSMGLILYRPGLWRGYRDHGFGGIPRSATKIFITNSGLKILVPANEQDDRLWDAPPPAAPTPKANLELRGDTLRNGFRTRTDR